MLHTSNIRQRLQKRNQEANRDISKSASNLHQFNHPNSSTCHVEDLDPSASQIHLRRRKSATELTSEAETAPVLRRRRFTRKQRKSLIIEPETGLILAAGRRDSTSSEEDTEKSLPNLNNSSSPSPSQYKRRSRHADQSHEKGPAARRAARLLKRAQQHASSTSHLVDPEMFRENGLRNQARSLSVRDVNGENIDFTNRDSVSKWTSQILAELDSLPSSCVDLTRIGAGKSESPETEKRFSMNLAIPSSSSRMTCSMFDEATSSASKQTPDPAWTSLTTSTTSLPTWAREREDSVGASTLVMQSSSEDSDGLEEEEDGEKTPPVINENDKKNHMNLLVKLAELSKSDFVRIRQSSAPPPAQHAPPIPAKRTKFPEIVIEEQKEEEKPAKVPIRKRLEDVFNEADRRLQSSIARMTQSVYGDLRDMKASPRFSIPIIRTSSESSEQHENSNTQPRGLDKWQKMAECRAKKDKDKEKEKDESTMNVAKSPATNITTTVVSSIGEVEGGEGQGEEEHQIQVGEDKPRNVNRVISALIKTIEDSRYSASDRPQDLPITSIDKNKIIMDFLSQDAGTQTTPFAASRSSSFDWINEPTEGALRDIQTPLATPRAEFLRNSKTFAESSSDEADREVAQIHNSCQTETKRQLTPVHNGFKSGSQPMYQQIDEGLALLLEYGEPSAVKLHKEMQNQAQIQAQNSNHQLQKHSYDSLPTKLRQSVIGRRSGSGPQLVDSVYDNMPWDKKKHLTQTGQFSPLVLPRNPSNRSSIIQEPSPKLKLSQNALEEQPVNHNIQNGASPNNIQINNNITSKSFALQLAERDAEEASAWLKQAGFPQYVKQFEEGKFPIDTSIVERDHGFLGRDSLRALFRRIDTLNRCAIMKVDNVVMRRRMNNDYLYSNGYDEDDNVALSGNWQYQRQSQTWSRIPPNESVYGTTGSHSRLVSTKPNWQPIYMEKQNGHSTNDRQVSRTNWYEAQETRGRVSNGDTSTLDHSSTSGVCLNGTASSSSTSSSAAAAAAKLQRSQSERIRDRARAIMKKMDLRSTSRRRKESRHRESPASATAPHGLVIGDPVLVSYDTATTDSMRMMNSARPNNLTDRGRTLYSTPPQSRDGSFQQNPRSKSARRQGMVVLTPSSPESSDDSFGATGSSTSAMTSSSLIGGGGMPRRRDCSMPPPSNRNIRRNQAQNYEYTIADPLMMSIPRRRERERTPFDAYLYPGSPNSLTRQNRSSGLSRVPIPSSTTYEPHLPPRDYHPPPPPSSSLQNGSNNGLLQRTDRAHNLIIQSDGYYMHDMSPEMLRRRIEDSPSTSQLKVDTQKSESSVEHTDEENLLSTLHRRRDSGVGSSLSRSPSGPSNQRIRQSILQYSLPLISSSMMSGTNTTSLSSNGSWQNFKKRNASLMATSLTSSSGVDETFFTDVEMARSMNSLNIIEMTRLRKLAYLQVTAILEKSMGTAGKIGGYNLSGNENDGNSTAKHTNWSVHKLIKKMKISDGKVPKEGDDSGVFGLSLDTIYRRSGFCLPRPILEILRFLRQMAPETVGIFRKNGVKSRIAELRAIADRDASPLSDVFVGDNNLDPGQVHDVADLLKQYLRELPEPLMTIKMSDTFANIFTYVPEVDRLAAIQYALLLMPDENREAVQTLMMFLRDVAKYSQVNNMTAQNLAVCFTPSLFQLSASRLDKISSGSRRHKTIGAAGMPTEKEMKETRACQQCLTMLIDYAKTIFMAPDCIDERAEFEDDIPSLKDLGLKGPRSFLIDRVLDMIKDHSDRWKGWLSEGSHSGVEITSKKANDSHPLKTFRVWIDVEAPPKVVMSRIMKERHVWDTTIINWRHLEYVHAPDTDIHQYVVNETISHPTKDCHLVRFHSAGLTEIRGACAIAERSVQCSEPQMLGGLAAAVLDQRFLIEPKSGGQSRVTYIARVDLKGRTWQWYNKVYGSIMSRQMIRLRDSFQSEDINNGPETKI